MKKAYLNGAECIFYYNERFSSEHAPDNYPYMYQLRHDEDDWTIPVTLEKVVFVNFFGTVFLKEPVVFCEDSYVEISDFEIDDDDMIRFSITPDFIQNSYLKEQD